MLFSIGGSTVFELEGDGQIKLKNNTTVDATTDDIIEAIEDLITDCKDKSMDFIFDDDDDYGSYEKETDFTQLEI